jgi:O-antigen/teichoic acid export membrane protein
MLNMLIAVHEERALYRNTIVFAVVNVVLSVILIRRYGEVGAAVAMLVSSAASQVSLSLLPATGPWVKPCLLAGVRVFVAVGAGVAIGRWAGSGVLVALVLALAVYLVTLVVLGVLNREEMTFVRTVLGSVRGGPGA